MFLTVAIALGDMILIKQSVDATPSDQMQALLTPTNG